MIIFTDISSDAFSISILPFLRRETDGKGRERGFNSFFCLRSSILYVFTEQRGGFFASKGSALSETRISKWNCLRFMFAIISISRLKWKQKRGGEKRGGLKGEKNSFSISNAFLRIFLLRSFGMMYTSNKFHFENDRIDGRGEVQKWRRVVIAMLLVLLSPIQQTKLLATQHPNSPRKLQSCGCWRLFSAH